MTVFTRQPKNNHSQKTEGKIFWIEPNTNNGLDSFIQENIADSNTVKITIENIEMPFAVCKVTKVM